MFPKKIYICYVYIWIQLVTIEKEFICYSAVVILLHDWRYFLGYFIKFIWIIVLAFQVPQVCFESRFSLIIRVPGLRSDPWVGSQVSGPTFKIPCFGSWFTLKEGPGSQVSGLTKSPGSRILLFRYAYEKLLSVA